MRHIMYTTLPKLRRHRGKHHLIAWYT